MKVPSIKGSFQLRKIYGGEYWYRYWWDPATKKMQCKREDPPAEYIPKDKPKKEDLKFTNGLPMFIKDQDFTLRQQLLTLIEQGLPGKLQDPKDGKHKDTYKVKAFIQKFLLPKLIQQVYEEICASEPGFTRLIPLNFLKQKLPEIPNEEIDQCLLDLERTREVDLQIAYDPSEEHRKYGIPTQKGLVMYLRWRE